VVYLGDNIIKEGISKFVKDFTKSDYNAGLLLAEADDPTRYGVVELNAKGEIISVEEKPKMPKSNFVLTGVYFFTSCIFDVIETLKPSWRNELEITDAIRSLITSGKHNLTHYFVEGWWDDTGTPEDIVEANRYVLDHDLKQSNKGIIEDEVSIHGRVHIDEGTVIKRGSVIRGPVCIGKCCEIGPKTYIGPYTSIGDRCVLRNANVESSVILKDARIICSARIVDSLIGQGAHILSSALTLPRGQRFILGESSHIWLDET